MGKATVDTGETGETSEVQDWLERPIFVTGLMKSGTTLLLSLLDGHPDILAYPDEPSFHRTLLREYESREQMLVDFLYGTPNRAHFGAEILERDPELLKADLLSWSEPAPFSTVPSRDEFEELVDNKVLRSMDEPQQEKAIDLEAYFEEIYGFFEDESVRTPKELIRRTMKALAKARRADADAGYEHWLFKQPFAHFREGKLDWFRDTYPAGKMIVLLRDPRGYVNSLLDYVQARWPDGRKWRLPPDVARMLSFLTRVTDVRSDYRGFLFLDEREPVVDVLPLTYESVVRNTEGTMRRVARFLELPFDDILTRPTKLGVSVRVTTATDDTKADKVYSKSVRKWEHQLKPTQIAILESLCGEVLQREIFEDAVSSSALQKAIRPVAGSVTGLLDRLRRAALQLESPPGGPFV